MTYSEQIEEQRRRSAMYSNCESSPCVFNCIGIRFKHEGNKTKYILGVGDCRAPASDQCCMNAQRNTSDRN